jgi:hypothetical protein
MRLLSVVVSIVVLDHVCAPLAVAQTRVTTFDELRGELAPGDAISLVRTSGESLKGRFLRFGDSDLEVRVDLPRQPGRADRRRDVAIPFDTVRLLERPRDSSRNGA